MTSPRDTVPSFNPNPDRGSIPGFRSGVAYGPRPGEVNKILKNTGDPISTHLHKHPDGITISTYRSGVPIERYNFNTGLQEK